MNFLILSCGTRNNLISYFKKSVDGTGKVFAADCSENAPALYEADGYFVIPRITSSDYETEILRICNQEKIDGVLSLIDPELSMLAKLQPRLAEIGTTVIGSDYELCELSRDKYQMYQWLSAHGYPCAKSYRSMAEFDRDIENGTASYPAFVKPAHGSASVSVFNVENRDDAQSLFSKHVDMMIQGFVKGQEIGADVYIDLISGEVVSIFTKKKLVMRAGETDKAVSFRDPMLFDLIERFCLESGYRGAIDIDLFDVNGHYLISEVNPRFGGGYPHAHLCGCDHVQMIVNNLQGKVNAKQIGNYADDVYMMKYSEVMLRPEK